MKQKWNQRRIDTWMKLQVEHPSSEFQRKSEAWLRTLRQQPVQKSPSRWSWSLTAISLPLTAIAALTIMFVIKPGKSEDVIIQGLKTNEILVFEELVEMDQLLANGSVILDSDQLEILQALSSLPELNSSLPI